MISCLSGDLPSFPGKANHVRCFLHVINLVAKTLLSPFQAPESGSGGDSMVVLGEELDGIDQDIEVEDDEEDDDMDGWVDELKAMDEVDRANLDKDIQPLRTVVTKVCERNLG